MIIGHGNDAYHYGDTIKMDFSSSIYTHADHTALLQHLAGCQHLLKSYPEPEPSSLERLIADQIGVLPQSVMVTAGVTEAIYLIAQLYKGYASVIPQPTFSEYADACKVNDHVISYYDNDEMEVLPEKRLYWICNPNNPTGAVMSKSLITYVIRHHQQYVFVVDQSLEHFTNHQLLDYVDMKDCHNLILLQSLSKRFCAPGIRVGYLVASPIIVDRLRQIRHPWSVSALDIEAAKFLLAHGKECVADRDAYMEEARRLHHELSQIDGLMLMDTDSNIMLCYLEQSEARQLRKWLIDNYGILIRDASNFHGLDSHCFRVSTQLPEENNALIAAITEYQKGVSRHFKKYW